MIVSLFGKEYTISYKKIILFLVVFAITVQIAFGMSKSKSDNTIVVNQTTIQPAATEQPTFFKKENSYINVYVTGQVKKPGVYQLKKGSLVYDAIKMAGGAKADANLSLNLAWEMQENMMIYLPSKKGKKIPVISSSAGTASESNVDENSNKSGDSQKVDINNAGKEELMTVPWIGESTANSIIEFREKEKFKTIEDIKKVSGIGDGKFDKMKDHIVVK